METVKGPNLHHCHDGILMPTLEGSIEQWNKKISWDLPQSMDHYRLIVQQTLNSKIPQSGWVLGVHLTEPATGRKTFRSSDRYPLSLLRNQCYEWRKHLKNKHVVNQTRQTPPEPYRHRLITDSLVYKDLCVQVYT